MTEIPFIVIMPAYNAERFLERSISSVTGQAYPNYRMVIVDDGSTDQTGAVAEEYARHNPKITVIHQSNSGQILSRSNGIRCAKERFAVDGAYFLFLDADDAFAPNAFSRIRALLTEHPCDLLVFDVRRVNSANSGAEGVLGGSAEGLVTDKAELYKIVLLQYQYNSLCRKAVSAAIVEDACYEPYAQLRHAEDLVQSLDYYRAAKRVFFVSEPLYLYYYNEASVTHRITLREYPVDSVVRALTWRFVVEENVWSQEELDAYALFLLRLLEKKITNIALMQGTALEKAEVYERLKQDPFFSELLAKALPHSRVIKQFLKSDYAAVTRTVRLQRLTNVFKRR